MAATPVQHRRRFLRFSLRTLLIAVTVAGAAVGWVVWQRQIVRDRWAMRSWLKSQDAWVFPDLIWAQLSIRNRRHEKPNPREMLVAISRHQKVHGTLPIVRQWFGDEYVEGMYLSDALSNRRREIERLFSESTILFESDAITDELEERDRRVQRTLSAPTLLEFESADLPDILAYLADLHNVDIRLDTDALEKAQIDPAVLLTFQAQHLTLREALVQLLAPLKLTFFTGRGAIAVTTMPVALE
jgi:hypothetical protein